MSDDVLTLTENQLAYIIYALRRIKPRVEQFVALGVLVEEVMRDWPSDVCLAMLAGLESRFGPSGSPERPHVVSPLPN